MNKGNNKGPLLIIITLIIVGSLVFAGMNSVVKTKNGYKLYPKSSFNFESSYVDMTNTSFLGLRNHPDLIKNMVENGDTELLPGGTILIKAAEVGMGTMEAINTFDDEYQVSSSMEEVARIGSEKFEIIDEKYQVKEKAEKINEKAKEGAKKLNKWLKSQ